MAYSGRKRLASVAFQAGKYAYKNRKSIAKMFSIARPRRGMRRSGMRGSRGPKKSPGSNSTWMSIGFPIKISGVLKSYYANANLESPTGEKYLGVINLCDMNNDQRTAQGTVANEGTSHWVTGGAPVISQIFTPYYFDTLKGLYKNYLIKKIHIRLQICNIDVSTQDDITIAYKLLRGHDDESEDLRGATTAELIICQPGIKLLHLNPQAAARTGRPSRQTINLTYDVMKMVPKRLYFAEATEAGGVGEKDFSATTGYSRGTAAQAPRVMFWAWKTFTGNSVDADSLSLEQNIWYTYTAYNRIQQTLS